MLGVILDNPPTGNKLKAYSLFHQILGVAFFSNFSVAIQNVCVIFSCIILFYLSPTSLKI